MYCKVCGKKLEGTEKFCSDCGNPIDYSDVLSTPNDAARSEDDGFTFSKASFHMDGMNWDLEGYPTDEKKTDRVDFDWASVLEGKERKAAEERRRAISMTEDDIYERIQSDRHNNEFDWDLVHTMRLDRAGRSELSLFHEDDEELFSVDFIPPLNTADSYESMASSDSIAPQSKGTVVIDRIDKSEIEEAATEAAGIQERDYAALGINVNQPQKTAQPPQARRKIEKFYTFNRKNEEFQALLDQEYERIRQKVQEQTELEELKSALVPEAEVAEEAVVSEEAAPIAEAAPMTRGEVAKASAEAEADEAERLAEEAERLAAEAEARAKAAEEAAAKAAAEAQAAEEALKAMEEEEARAAEEAARLAEEEAARIAAEEEAARIAEEDIEAKLKAAEEAALKAKAAEEAALAAEAELADIEEIEDLTDIEEVADIDAELGVKAALTEEAAKLALEEAAIDAELEKLNASHRALEAEAARLEAGIYDDDEVEEEIVEDSRRKRYDEIFDDEDDDDDYDEKRGGCRTLLLDIIIVILILLVALSCLLIFLPDHAVSKKIKSYIPFFNQGVIEEIVQPEEQTQPEEQAQAEEPEPEPEPTVSDTAAAITKAGSSVAKLGAVSEDPTLIFASGTDYGIEGVEQATPFTNVEWYKSDSGESVTYVDAVVGTVIDYYSKLTDKKNNDDNAVLDLVAEDSALYGVLSAMSADSEVSYTIESLKVGEIRSNSNDFYVLVTVVEKASNAEATEVTKELIHMQANSDNAMKIIDVAYVQ